MSDILDRIDQTLGCQQCGGDLGDSPSRDFCGEDCQQTWHAARADTPPTPCSAMAEVLAGREVPIVRIPDVAAIEEAPEGWTVTITPDLTGWEETIRRIRQDMVRLAVLPAEQCPHRVGCACGSPQHAGVIHREAACLDVHILPPPEADRLAPERVQEDQ